MIAAFSIVWKDALSTIIPVHECPILNRALVVELLLAGQLGKSQSRHLMICFYAKSSRIWFKAIRVMYRFRYLQYYGVCKTHYGDGIPAAFAWRIRYDGTQHDGQISHTNIVIPGLQNIPMMFAELMNISNRIPRIINRTWTSLIPISA